jgi:signal transduction histidine kinase
MNAFGAWVRRGATAAGRGLVLYGLLQLGALLGAALLTAIGSIAWIVLVPAAVSAVRWLANLSRRLTAAWCGVEIPVPYRPRPPLNDGLKGWWQRVSWIVTDPATWRDLLWLQLAPAVGTFLVGLPVVLLACGVLGVIEPLVSWYGWTGRTLPVAAWVAAALGVVAILAGLAAGPRLLTVHARFTRWLLAPTAGARLASRVRQLTETRSDAVKAQAAELRRIERDLHDGAQARLVAVGMTLSAADHLLDTDPKASRALLNEAREASAKALDELRDLVRGIHPPVLADRGLGDAVRALALESGMRVTVSVDVPGRLEPAVESAAYFAIAEVLANAAKHSGARHVALDVRHHDGVLRMVVTDDGCGGARIGRGTGLRGIQRRLAPFDGTLALDSPAGGPTTVTMELPCVLSSPKTTLCSATD